MWKVIWFFSNIAFVATLIWYMFLHRAYADSLFRKDSPEKLVRHRRRRKTAALTSVVLFIVMATAFLTDMKMNG
ncbi:hypothetical protein SAMN05444162_0303 [Paenibacillaceae bacterium GAS479]|nr:hypothetical protein SAMN05444162_0303 [Paenibacillaceae bacterium GAS479]